jgi:lipid-binding SYLF domain-containing protein
LRPDNGANEKLYGHKLTAKEILREGKVGTPAAGHELDTVLTKASPKNLSDPKSLE